MSNDASKKLFIFLGVLLLLIIVGPYLGIHLLGEPVIPERQKHVIEHGGPPIPETLDMEELPPIEQDELVYGEN